MKMARPKKVLKLILGIILGVIFSQLFTSTSKFCSPQTVQKSAEIDDTDYLKSTPRSKNLLLVGKKWFLPNVLNIFLHYW